MTIEGQPAPWTPEQDPLVLALLGKFLEELGELQAILARCLIQGLNESNPVTNKPNLETLGEELADVGAAGQLLTAYLGLDRDPSLARRQEQKMLFLNKWHAMIRRPM